MKVYEREGKHYTLQNGTEVPVEDYELQAKIKAYMKEEGCDLETATIEVVDAHDKADDEQGHEGEVYNAGTYYPVEGESEAGEINSYMKDNNVDYEEAFTEVYSRKTKDGSQARFKAESDVEKNEITLKDNDSNHKITFKKTDIDDYAREHNCDLIEAEKVVFSRNISALKARCY